MRSNPYTYIIIFLFTIVSFNIKGSTIDSLATPSLWLEQQNEIGYDLLRDGRQFNNAVQIFQSAQDFAISQNLQDQFTEITIGLGIALYKNGNIENAYVTLHKVLPKIKNSESKIKAEVNQIVGMALAFKNQFSEGYKHQMDALKYYSDINDSLGMMSVYYDLGGNFHVQNQSKLAQENYEKGIAIARALKDNKLIIEGTTALGGTYASLNDFEKAIEYIDESMELAKVSNDDEELAWASVTGGHILGNLKRYKKAERYLDQAYELSFKIENRLLTAYSLEQMSELCFKQKNFNKSLEKLDESYKIFQDLGQTNRVKEVTRKYAEIYFEQKNFVKYKEYNDQYMQLKDSLYTSEMMESMANLKQDFKIHELERNNQIALLTKEKELTKAKFKSRITITLAGLVSFGLLLFLMYSRNKSEREKNEILRAKNDEILKQNKSLADSNRDLEKFAYIISHDLKEPLRNINGFTKLLLKKVTEINKDENIKEYASFITNGTQQMEDLLNGLLEYSKIGVVKNEKALVDLNQLLTQVTSSLKIQLDEKKCEVEIKPLPSIQCCSIQMTQVFQNLVANAIKFSDELGNKIEIGAEEMEDEYRFFVKDNGIGIDLEYQKDIFQVFKRLHDRGSYTGSGIGLSTCKKIIDDHGGRIWVESKKGEGACFSFTLPKVKPSETNETDQPQTEEVELV